MHNNRYKVTNQGIIIRSIRINKNLIFVSCLFSMNNNAQSRVILIKAIILLQIQYYFALNKIKARRFYLTRFN